MTGDYHEANTAALGKVRRLLNGEFEEIPDAGRVASNLAPVIKEPDMANKKQAGETVIEKTLPGMEEEALPPALEKAITKYHAVDAVAAQSRVENKKNVDAAFATVKNQMHEHSVKEVKLRIDGQWKKFRLLNQEKGKFEKIKQPSSQKATVVLK